MKGPDNQQQEQLLIEAAQQDPSRLAELYELHFERVYAYIARRVRERSAAEELTSHVFHQALANLGKFKWRRPFRGVALPHSNQLDCRSRNLEGSPAWMVG